jgi:two-component system, OmpR family, copper resistance phosphate regulon response regulator CusR
LSENGYQVDIAVDGNEAEQMAERNEYDLILLDLMLPKKSGFVVCRNIRKYNAQIPILVLTALDSTDDKVDIFEKGADDYLVKPFAFKELLIRIMALIRRSSTSNAETGSIIQIADLKMDLTNKIVSRAGEDIKLTAKEYSLLKYLMLNRKRILSRSEIAEKVWETSFDTESNNVEVYINFLRRKIDRGYDKKLIHTVIGMGYVMKEEA